MGGRPKAPNPAEVSAAQTKSNIDTATAQQGLNMVNQVTPGGNLTYEQIGVNEDGTPKFQATTTLSPEQQALYDQQNQFAGGLSQLGLDQLGRVSGTLGTPVDLSDPTIGTEIANRYQPRLQEARTRDMASLETALANKGLKVGSTAYERELANLNQSYGDRENQINIDARGQTIAEILAQRNQPLSELTTLMNAGQGGVTGPQLTNTPQTGVANTDVTTPVYESYNQQMAQRNARMQGLFGLGSALLGGWAMSEPKTKQDIKRVGTLDNGLPIYVFRYRPEYGGGPMQLGLMADDVDGVFPDAVAEIEPGIRAVNYAAVADALAERSA